MALMHNIRPSILLPERCQFLTPRCGAIRGASAQFSANAEGENVFAGGGARAPFQTLLRWLSLLELDAYVLLQIKILQCLMDFRFQMVRACRIDLKHKSHVEL